jgi:putative spermidine/putrescine transport system ATP-binding protein
MTQEHIPIRKDATCSERAVMEGMMQGDERRKYSLTPRKPDQHDPTGAAVTLDHVSKRFGSFVAIDDVSLRINAGEFITFLGPSGSGKTTMLLMIAGFEDPTTGEILIGSRSIVATPPYRRNIGMVFQSYALFPHMTVAENVGFALKQRGFARATIMDRVAQALDIVRLAGYQSRYPRQLSGGQQQRVALARAIIFNPRVLLMDEPLSALDRQLRDELQLEIKRLHRQLGMTFIYVTHDQREALVMSDRIAVVNRGRIEQAGNPTDLYDRPANRFVASFIGESNFLEGTVCGFDGSYVLVRLGRTIARAAGQNQRQVGASVALAVRPEKMSFRDQDGDGNSDEQNTLAGRVRESTFVGDTHRYVIETDFGALVTLKQQHRHALRSRIPSERVIIEWHVQDTLIA